MSGPVICKEAEIIMKGDGNVSFGNGCVIHPRASIIAEEGCNIIFGEFNIVEENVVIKASPKFNSMLNNKSPTTVYIGSYNHFKVGVRLENTSVENYNIIEYRVEADDCQIESKTIITPMIKLPKRASIKTASVVLDNKIIVTNTSFKENDFKKYITEIYNSLASLLPKAHKLHVISS
jgi:carbonic anhydrase/acetyltransferase-like protein (isoleucine patch superfamily)